MEYIWGAPEPEPEQLEAPSNAAGSVRAMEEDLMVLLQQLQQAQLAQQELQEEVSRSREREAEAKSSAEQAYALVSEVQEKFREQIDSVSREHAAKTEAAEAEAAEAKAKLQRAQLEAQGAPKQLGAGNDEVLAAKLSLIERTLTQMEADLETPPSTPRKLSDSSDEDVATRLRRLSSTPRKLSSSSVATPAAAEAKTLTEAVKKAEQRTAEEGPSRRAEDQVTIAELQTELTQAKAEMAEAVRAEQVKTAEAEGVVATALAEAAAMAAAINSAASTEEDRKLAELAEELAAARSQVAAAKKAADERVAIAMSSAVMAEQQRSELQSSLNLQLAQAREEVRKEAVAAQRAAVAVVATERDDAKAALLLAAKEAQDEVAEAQMLQQERVAAVEKQLVREHNSQDLVCCVRSEVDRSCRQGLALERAATAEGKVSALMLQAASDADRIESLQSRLSMAERQAAILGAR